MAGEQSAQVPSSPSRSSAGNSSLLFIVAASSALLWFMLFLSLLGSRLAGEGLEWAMYLIAGVAVPLLGLGYASGVQRAAQKAADPGQHLAKAALVTAVFGLAALASARLGVNPGPGPGTLAAAALLVVAGAVGLRPGGGSSPGAGRDWIRPARFAAVVLLSVFVLSFLSAPSAREVTWGGAALGVVVAGLALGAGRSNEAYLGRRTDLLVVAFLTLLLLTLRAPIDPHHAGFYLAPANQIRHGGALLVDTFAQYGVLPIYLISLLGSSGLALGYWSLGLMVSALAAVQYSLIYLLLRRLVASRATAAGVTLMIAGLSVYTVHFVSYTYPSIGPLRFLPPYLLLYLDARFRQKGSGTVRARLAEAGVVGAASLWSAETLVYTLGTLGGLLLFEAVRGRQVKPGAVRLARALSGMVAAHTLLVLVTLADSGELPRWGTYLKFLTTYTTGQFGALPIDAWTLWGLIAAVYVGTVVGLGTQLRSERTGDAGRDLLPTVAGLAALGIVTMSYFVGRSHPWNLRHICAPALMLGALGLGAVQVASRVTQAYPGDLRLLRAGGAGTFLERRAGAFRPREHLGPGFDRAADLFRGPHPAGFRSPVGGAPAGS